jgi:hypothetical protein
MDGVGVDMQYFPLLAFQHLVLAFFLGVGFVILLYLAFSGYKRTRKEATGKERERLKRGELAEAHDPEGNRIPPVLILIFVGAILWAVSYVVVVGIKGVAF